MTLLSVLDTELHDFEFRMIYSKVANLLRHWKNKNKIRLLKKC